MPLKRLLDVKTGDMLVQNGAVIYTFMEAPHTNPAGNYGDGIGVIARVKWYDGGESIRIWGEDEARLCILDITDAEVPDGTHP